MDNFTGHTTQGGPRGSAMTKTNVRIGTFEIDDAELGGENRETGR